MLTIVLLMGIGSTFYRKAWEKELNRYLWAFLGIAAYYVPMLLMSLVVFPMLITNGTLRATSPSELEGIVFITNLVLGMVCCFLAYRYLQNLPSLDDVPDNDVLDGNVK